MSLALVMPLLKMARSPNDPRFLDYLVTWQSEFARVPPRAPEPLNTGILGTRLFACDRFRRKLCSVYRPLSYPSPSPIINPGSATDLMQSFGPLYDYGCCAEHAVEEQSLKMRMPNFRSLLLCVLSVLFVIAFTTCNM